MDTYQQASVWFNANFAEFLRLNGYLDVFPQPVDQLPAKIECLEISHGDKAPQYEKRWEAAGVPYRHGLMLYLLSYLPPYSASVRYVGKKWVDPCVWVIGRHKEYRDALEQVEVFDKYNGLMKKYVEEEGMPRMMAHERAIIEVNK